MFLALLQLSKGHVVSLNPSTKRSEDGGMEMLKYNLAYRYIMLGSFVAYWLYSVTTLTSRVLEFVHRWEHQLFGPLSLYRSLSIGTLDYSYFFVNATGVDRKKPA